VNSLASSLRQALRLTVCFVTFPAFGTWASLLTPPPGRPLSQNRRLRCRQLWRRVTVPVLVVQAGRDSFVPVEESIRAIDDALREARNPDYTILVLPGAPHNLVLQPSANSSLKWPRLYPGYADLLVGWIKVPHRRSPCSPARGRTPIGIPALRSAPSIWWKSAGGASAGPFVEPMEIAAREFTTLQPL